MTSQAANESGITTIHEGSAVMYVPASAPEKESKQKKKKNDTPAPNAAAAPTTVFYNPVQVQNRDLSILMIALYAERRAVRSAVKAKKKELLKERRQQAQAQTSSSSTPKVLSSREFQAQLEQTLREYEAALNPIELVQEQTKERANGDHETTKNDTSPSPNHGISVFEALAASGLRSVRYWKEIPGIHHITINDMDTAAVERAHENLKDNNLLSELITEDNDFTTSNIRKCGIRINQGDATHELYMSRRPQQTREPFSPTQRKQEPRWDVIDLDPYGSAAPFLDGAVQAVESGGMLCVTCTDMAALGGSHPETAYGRYAGLPIQSARYLQELAIRLLLHTIAVSAARYGRTIRPILSVGMAFYVRVFVEVVDDKKGVQDLSLNIGNVYQSTQCSTFFCLPHGQMGGKKGNVYQSRRLVAPASTGSGKSTLCCPETGAPLKVGGPLWLGPLHDPEVLDTALNRLQIQNSTTPNSANQPSTSPATSPDMNLIATQKRLLGLLTTCREELSHDGNNALLYWALPDMAQVLRCSCPPLQQAKAALVNAGYQVSGYHKDPEAIKTNAPSQVVWDVMRQWAKENPPKNDLVEGSPGAKVMSIPMQTKIDWTIPESMRGKTKKGEKPIARFPMNPSKGWGPKRAATGYSKDVPASIIDSEEPASKRRATEKSEDNSNEKKVQ